MNINGTEEKTASEEKKTSNDKLIKIKPFSELK